MKTRAESHMKNVTKGQMRGREEKKHDGDRIKMMIG